MEVWQALFGAIGVLLLGVLAWEVVTLRNDRVGDTLSEVVRSELRSNRKFKVLFTGGMFAFVGFIAWFVLHIWGTA